MLTLAPLAASPPLHPSRRRRRRRRPPLAMAATALLLLPARFLNPKPYNLNPTT